MTPHRCGPVTEEREGDGIRDDEPLHQRGLKTFPDATDAEVDAALLSMPASKEFMNHKVITTAGVGQLA